ncbi:zinc finger protein interacting with ribonucleoprotein K [Folsomia candida]|uniref:zinc finger protein interacting with ribonucleoprotein K n=1 Tax=Folsomia candida TaxID=158441 RepID=UPI001604B837|nr:zinc finger protein interacting with ribonucleoprotein K [Folsomia candida]XP_035716105.1 zinc finger protein interacting with ribonucleoprotein K [Folsomia candida]XP_035716106.1 zinc finger protein interacting with ribonucleoprotein K [Folsomia candida]
METCTFCGGHDPCVVPSPENGALSSYSASCVTSLLTVFHIDAADPVAAHLATAALTCADCLQLTRDIDLELRSLLKFLKNLDLLRSRLARRVKRAAKKSKSSATRDLNERIQQEIPLVNQAFETFSNLLRIKKRANNEPHKKRGENCKVEFATTIKSPETICKQEMLVLPEIKDEPLSDQESETNVSHEMITNLPDNLSLDDFIPPDSDQEEESSENAGDDFNPGEISSDSDPEWEGEEQPKKQRKKRDLSTPTKSPRKPRRTLSSKPPKKPKPSPKPKPHTCPTCLKTYSTLLSLEKHVYLVHPTTNTPSPFTCSICALPFPSQPDLDTHIATHLTNPTPFQCTLCDAVLSNSSQLKTHLSTVHKMGKRSLPCGTCGALFSRHASLLVHQKIHSDSFVGHECTVCGLRCMSKAVLAVHMGKHATTKQFVCEVCGKSFTYQKGLRLHSREHVEGEDLLKTECRLCGKRFKTNSQLYRHEETHVGTLQHACQYCGKRFKTSNNIRQHENYYCAGGPRRKSGGKAAEGRVGNLVDL